MTLLDTGRAHRDGEVERHHQVLRRSRKSNAWQPALKTSPELRAAFNEFLAASSRTAPTCAW